MRRIILALPALFALSAPAAAAVDYTAFCEIEGGVAKGYVTVSSYDSLTVSGYVTIRTYDADGDLLDTDRGYEYAYIYHDTELVAEVDADADARWCSFDVSEAVDDPTPPSPPSTVNYSTWCEIVDGKARGWVTVPGFDSLTISGYVKFKIFDDDGDLIDEETTHEYEYIYHDTEMVAEVGVDDEARRCSFDVSDAIDD